MPITIEPSSKFSCYAFQLFSIDEAFHEDLELDEGLWALRNPPVAMDQDWQTWLGTYISEALRDSNFVLLAKTHSQQPEILDGENRELNKKVENLLCALLLLGVPEYEQGFSLSGANVNGEIRLRQFTKLYDYERSYEMPTFYVGAPEIRRTFNLSLKIRDINVGGPNWSRFRRGLNALLRGSREKDGGERLHQLVRALEALTKLGIREGRKQFAQRSQTFAVSNEYTQEALEEIYKIRNKLEHLDSPLDALTGTEEERIERANLRTRQIDCLSRFAFARVLESPELLEIYRTDDNIDQFNSRPDNERMGIWGDRLDLSAT